ncbi:hypothetical protein E2C01_019012 [Portunus trituberculatus]|uniref:Uncharacterized protein n=1 Tax=Portunus trituberculatus TaxID=210409 RepID=A0A5B7DWT3_PORTR|nr:hypothetical protein [Portunus trituberculatus]
MPISFFLVTPVSPTMLLTCFLVINCHLLQYPGLSPLSFSEFLPLP